MKLIAGTIINNRCQYCLKQGNYLACFLCILRIKNYAAMAQKEKKDIEEWEKEFYKDLEENDINNSL
ncbi:MAG: hypothetical protein ACYDEG_06545 [bacterium]